MIRKYEVVLLNEFADHGNTLRIDDIAAMNSHETLICLFLKFRKIHPHGCFGAGKDVYKRQGLKVSDALAVEASDSEAATTYGNVVAVKEGKEEDAKTKALIEALTSDAVKEYMEQTYEGAVVPLF